MAHTRTRYPKAKATSEKKARKEKRKKIRTSKNTYLDRMMSV